MKLQNNTLILASVYVAIVATGGVAAGVTSPSAWLCLGGLALLPACSVFVVSRRALQTRSPALQEVGR